MDLPYLFPDFSGIGGVLKQRPTDFVVEETPLYEPCGQGEHIYCRITKTGLNTLDVVRRFASALQISPRAIGYAGLKDANAVTRQVLSIQGVAPERVMAVKIPGVEVHWAIPHGNKLRLGHLSGNRFSIKVREVNPTDVVRIQPLLKDLADKGMPNYFGEQRFGRRGDNHLLGAAIIRQDAAELMAQLLGRPNFEADDAQTLGARKAFDQNDLRRAMKLFPRRSGMERRVLARLIKTGRPAPAVKAIDQRLRRLWVSALQSKAFNDVVAARIHTLSTLLDGDVAEKHDNGACFHVENAASEQPRCDQFAISPTGPLVGYRVTMPTGKALEIEQAALAQTGLKPEDFRREGGEKVRGARRSLRVKPTDLSASSGVDESGNYIQLDFALPAGSFATVLLRELMKPSEFEQENDGGVDHDSGGSDLPV